MLEENEDELDSQESSKPDDSLFIKLSQVKPPRTDVKLPEDEEKVEDKADGHGSLKKRMKESPTLSDMQTADKRLFPQIYIDGKFVEWLSNISISRVFPDTYNPYRNMIAKYLMQTYDEMSLVEAFSIADNVLSIALDGEGRIDELALIGRASAIEEEKNKKNII